MAVPVATITTTLAARPNANRNLGVHGRNDEFFGEDLATASNGGTWHRS